MDPGVDKIVSSIISEAQENANKIISEAEKKAESIIEDGEKRAAIEKEKYWKVLGNKLGCNITS
jgi:hypothetical protein